MYSKIVRFNAPLIKLQSHGKEESSTYHHLHWLPFVSHSNYGANNLLSSRFAYLYNRVARVGHANDQLLVPDHVRDTDSASLGYTAAL